MRRVTARHLCKLRFTAPQNCQCSCHKNFNNRSLLKRSVSTRSPLEISFNSLPEKKFDLWNKNVGLFGVPELSSPEGFIKAKDECIKKGWRLLDQAIAAKPGKETIILFDELSDTLCRVADLADFVRCAHPNQSYAQAANEAHVAIGTMVEELNTHSSLHKAMHDVVKDKELMASFDDETRRVAELFMFDFEISGIHLDSNKRSKAVKLHEEILNLTSAMLQGSGQPVAVPKNLLPTDLRELFGRMSGESDTIQLSGLHAEHTDERIREAAYRMYLFPNPGLEAILSRLLKSRYQLAHLVGYESYAERALKATIAQNPEQVSTFLNTLSASLKSPAEAEFDELRTLKRELGSTRELMPWDVHYLSSRLKEQRSNVNTDMFSSFFSLGDCMDGLNTIFQSLYGVSLQTVEPKKGEIWSPDVIKLAVQHETEGVIGYIYCDFFQRPGKPQQDCHFTIRGGRRMPDGSYQVPVVVLLLHLPSPTATNVTLLPPCSVNNLFHEAGHAMHSMLARTRYQHVTGTRCATDFAEVPSILMEYYANDEKVLSKFAKHHKTREALPPDMIKKLCEADHVCAASDMQLQVFYSMLDQVYHGVHPLPSSLGVTYAELHKQHYSLPHVAKTSWYLRFSHLASYGAKYYSYLMSRAVASRLWTKCFQKDPLNREMGERYKSKMLSHGGAREPIFMYEDMLQEKFDMDNLASTLVKSIK
uniref:mitochondrial intermediate peptidase-like n=1 Tax=Styela clava TaxID=7725 RepID=UPI00193AB9F6|nr:mitochondrial intermediate peptidase-like [Styela clava]